jgi:hypothetical protein
VLYVDVRSGRCRALLSEADRSPDLIDGRQLDVADVQLQVLGQPLLELEDLLLYLLALGEG